MSLENILSVWHSISIRDIVDITIITLVVFSILKIVKKTRSYQLLRGVALFFAVYAVAAVFNLRTILFLIQNFLQIGFLALLVLFQPEIRRALEQVGSVRFLSNFSFRRSVVTSPEIDGLRHAIVSICDGIERMSEHKTGALIVMEKFSNLDSIRKTGTAVNADITPELIGTIFYEGSPLHDGAVIVQNGRIDTAGCVLPLSENLDLSKDLGTRHRAALGLSEQCDALALVVSEETGIISVAKNGFITRELDRQMLYDMLTDEFITPIVETMEKQSKNTKEKRA